MISVIVPIFNVEDYFPRCLKSLNEQTYNDAEFILIDDGSVDRSGKIAESYTDSRFRIFHTMNHGLSAARNFGIDMARGEWLMFIDGDDFVEPAFCEKAYNAAIKNEADIVIFQAQFMKNEKPKMLRWGGGNAPVGIVDAETAIKYGGSAVWNKLYKRELFQTVRYPVGRAYEDLAVTHKVVFSANRIIMIPDVLYHYVYRKDSIGNTRSAKNKRDGFISALTYSRDLKEHGCTEELYLSMLWTKAILFLMTAYPSPDTVFHQAEEVVDAIPGIPRFIPLKYRMLLRVWKLSPSLFHFICRILGLKDNSSKEE